MSYMVAVKTCELAGAGLDWAVAKADGEQVVEFEGKHSVIVGFRLNPIRAPGGYTPSTDWSQGGPLIFEHRVNLLEVSDDCWEAWVTGREDHRYKGGDAPFVAICRAVVASQLGDAIEIPTELFTVHRPPHS
ncbi:phage protein NinX family protein [Pseudomonas sp. NPDC096950]|uniref:phage protein NinX family protein n=1 Tax=Pseudomonas sp. NPDC096950 TaxID=3364485 RepID=UPI00383B21FB